MPTVVSTIQDLEACIGSAGLPVRMKIIDHLDATAQRWIAASSLVFVGFGNAGGPAVSAAGGKPGFVGVRENKILQLPLAAVDDGLAIEIGQSAGTLFLVPGIGETLRANGRVVAVSTETVEVSIDECFVHCAKALIRSDFWKEQSPTEVPSDAHAFLNASRFLALATMDEKGQVDVSPKGDPAGLLIRAEGTHATLAERPGNKLAFGYHNIVEAPRVAALAIIPGSTSVVSLTGRAHLSTDETLRSAFAVDEKIPILATVIEDLRPRWRKSPALERAAPWNLSGEKSDVDPAATLVAHLKLNKERGAQAKILRLAVTRGAVASGLLNDYKARLY